MPCQAPSKIPKMPIPLFNSIASWLLKKRYHQIELFLKYPGEVQQEVLQQLLDFADETEIGLRYGFEDIASYHLLRKVSSESQSYHCSWFL